MTAEHPEEVKNLREGRMLADTVPGADTESPGEQHDGMSVVPTLSSKCLRATWRAKKLKLDTELRAFVEAFQLEPLPEEDSLTISGAAATFRNARETIFREIERQKEYENMLRTFYNEEDGDEGKGARYRETEGHFRPRPDGTIERGPGEWRLITSKANDSTTIAVGRGDVVPDEDITTANEPRPASNLLRKDKNLAKYMVPEGKETPLREAVTLHENANEIRRPQSRIAVVDHVEHEGNYFIVDWEDDDEIFYAMSIISQFKK